VLQDAAVDGPSSDGEAHFRWESNVENRDRRPELKHVRSTKKDLEKGQRAIENGEAKTAIVAAAALVGASMLASRQDEVTLTPANNMSDEEKPSEMLEPSEQSSWRS